MINITDINHYSIEITNIIIMLVVRYSVYTSIYYLVCLWSLCGRNTPDEQN